MQAFINIGVVAQLIPFTGQPLPFVSYGGSSLVVCMAGIGILLNISRSLPKPSVVKSVPVITGAAVPVRSAVLRSVQEKELTTKKNATISYRGGQADTYTRWSPCYNISPPPKPSI